MTIHSSHPFDSPDADRDPARRLRGRVGSTVSLWTAGSGRDRAGLTVSSYLVAAGDPSRIVAVLHPESELLERLEETGTAVVAFLDWRHRELADVFAGVMPSPGGPFRTGEWQDTAWGPHLAPLGTWAGVRLDAAATRDVGWSRLVEAVVEHVELGDDAEPLVHRRGRYQRPPT
ncbi:flavin reductase (DIM6/NTAB) family NADH-FMN oxidoreductase RutF [Humibacillus xanthopallidus]|uniref:Flavin reductase (DIM6/NTAB) family NADH-FMN oxidoreductase RutF n=1 Tax=Humibacillus xanthopallidus TaxID=412689 RepID=A0A543PUV7_9MICO|nr:flavin reductase [Humibacillus xanthopallidus]TQN47836.1 flavin reductase (DIM6/NTAB) family NADH-FMN oxidoreductase RutF [Humibacillus xanthopallidus]